MHNYRAGLSTLLSFLLQIAVSLLTVTDIIMCVVDGRLDVNVALNRPSYLSSTWTSGYGTYWASHGNDGDKTHCQVESTTNSIAHTELQSNPWFAVDLGVPLRVVSVNFTNILQGQSKCVTVLLLHYHTKLFCSRLEGSRILCRL